jgi:DNA-binding NarL/FixJ family response regulator
MDGTRIKRFRVDVVKVARAKRDMQILTALHEGFSVRKVAEAFGLSPARVCAIRKRVRSEALTN